MAAASSHIGAESGALTHFVFGRNEPALHHYHNTYNEFLGLPSLKFDMTRSTARLKPTSLQSAAITACLYLCLCLGGQTAPPWPMAVTAYVGATLIDGRGGRPKGTPQF